MGSRLPRKGKWLAVAVVVAAAGAGGWLWLRPSAADPAADPVTATATVDTQRDTVSATGTVAPARRADLRFAVDGEVAEVRVAEGDTVTAGQVLATVDDELLAADATAAAAELDAARARLDDQTAAGASDTQLAAAQAEVAAATSKRAAAEKARDQAELTATIAGTVVEVELAVGDQTGSGSTGEGEQTGQTGQTGGYITVVATNRYLVEARVAGADVERISAGMTVEVATTDLDEPAPGTVTTVGLVAETDEAGTATFPVTVDVTGERDDLYAGSTATVTIVVAQRDDVLTVPTQAVREDDGTTYVDKLVDGAAVRTEVTLGATYGPRTEIRTGLAEGDQVQLPAMTSGPGGGGGGLPRFPGGAGPGGAITEFQVGGR